MKHLGGKLKYKIIAKCHEECQTLKMKFKWDADNCQEEWQQFLRKIIIHVVGPACIFEATKNQDKKGLSIGQPAKGIDSDLSLHNPGFCATVLQGTWEEKGVYGFKSNGSDHQVKSESHKVSAALSSHPPTPTRFGKNSWSSAPSGKHKTCTLLFTNWKTAQDDIRHHLIRQH